MFGLFGRKAEEIIGDNDFETHIAGVTFYQRDLRNIFKSLTKTNSGWAHTEAILRLDNKNKHSENAVRVEIDGKLIGHLPEHGKYDEVNASDFREDFASGSSSKTFKVECKLKEIEVEKKNGLLNVFSKSKTEKIIIGRLDIFSDY